MRQKLPWYQFDAKAADGVAELRIFGPIGGGFFVDEDAITGKAIAEKLDGLAEDTKTIRVLVNSPGGSVFDGIHIANALRRQREEHGRNIEVEIEALAASAATLITSAGSSIKMPRNALMMIHTPVGYADGPKSIMLKVAEGLERATRAIVATYQWVSKLKAKKLRELMEATTWMDSDEALANGFITEIVNPIRARASFEASALSHLTRLTSSPLEDVPEKYRDRVASIFKEGAGLRSAICAGAQFADLANNAIDQRLEDDEDLTREDVLGELAEATGETTETIEEILSGELECPEGEVVDGFVEVLPITDEQAQAALAEDGCEGTEDGDGDDSEGKNTGDDAGTAGAINAGGRAANQGRGKMKKTTNKTNGEDQAIKAAERERITGIRNAVSTAIAAGLPEAHARELEKDAIEKELELEELRASLFDELAKKSNAGPPDGPSSPDITPGEDERDKRITGIKAALWHRSGVTNTIQAAAKKRPDNPAFKNLELDPGEFRGMSLLDHARDTLERIRAGSTRGRNKMELAGDFLNAAGGQQTTSDFAVALEDALHKALLAAYAIAPDTWRLFCSIGTVSDFRAHNRYTRGYFTKLDKVLESGEFKNKNVTDAAKEVQQAETYGDIIALSRQAIVNDDMGFFNDMAIALGRAAGLTIEIGVFDTLKLGSGLGPTMQDSKTLFHADHNNINSTGSGITVAGIDADRVVLAQQKDSSGGEYLDLRPAVLVLPIGLGGAARVLNESQYDHDGTKLMKPNAVVGLFRDIADSPRLSGTRRYIFADPAVAPVLEVAFLEGEQEPYIELKDGWRIDGVEWKVRHDFGIAAINYRGAVTNAGA